MYLEMLHIFRCRWSIRFRFQTHLGNIYARKLYGQATTVESINGATGGTVTGITAPGAITGNTLRGEIELGGPTAIIQYDVLTWNGSAWTALIAQGGGGGGGAYTRRPYELMLIM